MVLLNDRRCEKGGNTYAFEVAMNAVQAVHILQPSGGIEQLNAASG